MTSNGNSKFSEAAWLAAIVESSGDAIITKDLNGTIQTWNAGAELVFGYTAEEAIGQPVTMLMPEDRVNEEPGILARIRRGEYVSHYQTVRRRKDGKLIDISLNVSPVRDADGNIVAASKIARDITEHNRLQAAEREAEIARRLLETQESERRRIARDLHDHVGQYMTAIRLTIEGMVPMASDNAILSDELVKMKDIASRVDHDLSYLTWQLRPTEIEELGLRDALDSFVREWAEHTGIEAEFEFAGDRDNRRLDAVVETNLYRITQEALNNAAKYSQASHVTVLMHRQRTATFVIIEDDGIGFDVSSPPSAANGHGNGFSGMRERVELLNGRLLIESSPGRGTTVAVSIPANAARA
jgi:two-component system sensor histidine kinase UhpB